MASLEEQSNTDRIRKYLSESLKDLGNVYAAHKQSLESCEVEIAQWKKFLKDYNVLQEKLSTYPDKASYNEVIPIGPIAFMKGKKIHTNEILVHLGENWFAERSVKDAIGIIARRKEVCEENLKSAERLQKAHQGWLKQTQDLAEEKDQINILEHLSEEEYEKSKETHQDMISKHLSLMTLEEEEGEGEEEEGVSRPGGIRTYEDLLHRLDALEEEERIKDELIELGEEVSEGGEGSCSKEGVGGKEKLRRRVSWADQLAQRRLKEEQEEEEDEEEEEEEEEKKGEEGAETARIKYRSRQQSLPAELIASTWEGKGVPRGGTEGDATPDEGAVQTSPQGGSAPTTPQSPSDLYKMFGAQSDPASVGQPTKGILKRKGESFATDECEKGVGWSDAPESIAYIPSSPDEPEEPLLPRNPPLSESPKEIKNLKPAFSYKVVAREQGETTPTSPSTPGTPPTPLTPATPPEEESSKPVSRFKASRMSKK